MTPYDNPPTIVHNVLPDDPWWMDWLPLFVAVFAAVLAVAIQSWWDDRRHVRQAMREAHPGFAEASLNQILLFEEVEDADLAHKAAIDALKVQGASATPVEKRALEREYHDTLLALRDAHAKYLGATLRAQMARSGLRSVVSKEYSDLIDLSAFERMTDNFAIHNSIALGVRSAAHPARSERTRAKKTYRELISTKSFADVKAACEQERERRSSS